MLWRHSRLHTIFPLAASTVATIFLAAAPPHRSAPPVKSKPAPATAPAKVTVIENTQQAARGQPRVHVQISRDKRLLTGEAPPSAIPGLRLPEELGGAAGDDHARVDSFLAYLDTGASGHVISKSTARRFGIQRNPGAVYNEVGLHGETRVDVSLIYDLAFAGSSGSIGEPPPAKFPARQPEIAFQIAREEPSGLMALVGEMNIIGMPAIRKMVIELDPANMRGDAEFGAGPSVRVLGGKTLPKKIDLEIPLEYIDFNSRKHPENRGALPTLASNPVITAIASSHGQASFTGDWLLDTGAATSIISVKHAQALGLYNAEGTPALEPQFTLRLGGIGGDVKATGGYVIDRLSIKARGGKTLEFRRVHVIVKDIGTTLDSGRRVILDGVLGMNLLLPSASGIGLLGKADKTDPGGFEKIWIDGPRGMLGLGLR